VTKITFDYKFDKTLGPGVLPPKLRELIYENFRDGKFESKEYSSDCDIILSCENGFMESIVNTVKNYNEPSKIVIINIISRLQLFFDQDNKNITSVPTLS